MNNDQPKFDNHIIGGDLCQILENHLPSTDSLLDIPSPDVGSSISLLPDSLLDIPSPDVGSSINSRLPSATAMVNSSSSELSSCSNSSFRLEPPLGDRANEFPAFIQPEVPPAVAFPIPEHPSPVKIVGQGETAVQRHEPEVPLAILTYKVHNYTMKPQIIISFEDMTKILHDNYFPATKQPNGLYSCNFCSKLIRNKYDMRRHIRTHTREKIFQCSSCGERFIRKGDLKRHMQSKHKCISDK